MGQYTRGRLACALLASLFAILMPGCDEPSSPPANRPASTQASDKPTIASLVPAATDIILEMGIASQLVGVSNFEPANGALTNYERVGDYHNVDWEKLSRIRPAILVIPRPKQEVAGVFAERAARLGAELVSIHMDRLDEIFPVIQQLSEVTRNPQNGRELEARLRAQLTQAAQRAKGKQPIRTLIVLDENASFVVGPRNYLDDILTIAGGNNVGSTLGKDYPTIDREKLLQLDPDVIIQLLPNATPQLQQAAKQFWTTMPQLRAVKQDRIYVHTEPWLLLPSAKAGEVARLIATDLHGHQ